MTDGLYPFLVDFALALVTVVGVVALLWVWFQWLAERAGIGETPPAEPPAPAPDPNPPAPSATARAEIAELEALWALPPRPRGS
jgi:hypothetical protein